MLIFFNPKLMTLTVRLTVSVWGVKSESESGKHGLGIHKRKKKKVFFTIFYHCCVY